MLWIVLRLMLLSCFALRIDHAFHHDLIMLCIVLRIMLCIMLCSMLCIILIMLIMLA